VQLKQGKQASVRLASRHWHGRLLLQALACWLHYAQRRRVARGAMQRFRVRHLSAALGAWWRWYQRKAYLAAVFAQLQGRGHKQVRAETGAVIALATFLCSSRSDLV
jgi:hypothetical protein